MDKNVGTIDRALRVVVGLGLISLALFGSGIANSWLGWIGVVPLFTAAIGWCPAYALLGISTCPMKS